MRTHERLEGNRDFIRLLQITDTHLFSDEQGSLLGVNTLDSFRAVVDVVRQETQSFDAVIATGDLSQDHTPESYQRFVDGISLIDKPCYWLPGNHDNQPEMQQILAVKPMVKASTVLLGEHWQMVLLDSQVPGVPYGELSEQELDNLCTALDAYPERYTLILMHHHSVLAGSAWLDQHRLKNADSFWQRVANYPNVKAVVGGHIHQALDNVHQGVRVMASPSTCVQFKANSDDFALDNSNPGWRWLELHADGELVSDVERLNGCQFKPDMLSSGY